MNVVQKIRVTQVLRARVFSASFLQLRSEREDRYVYILTQTLIHTTNQQKTPLPGVLAHHGLTVDSFSHAQDDSIDEPKRTAYTTLRVQITDGDDLPPTFTYTGCTRHKGRCVNPVYRATVPSKGVVSISCLLPTLGAHLGSLNVIRMSVEPRRFGIVLALLSVQRNRHEAPSQSYLLALLIQLYNARF